MEGLTISALMFVIYASGLTAYAVAKRASADTARVFYINMLVLYGASLAALSLLPILIETGGAPEAIPLKRLIFSEKIGPDLLLYAFNFAVYLPFGFLSNLSGKLKGEPALIKTLLLALLASFSAEFLQMLLPIRRQCSVDDALMNGLGAAAGYFLFELAFLGKGMKRFMKNVLYK